MSFLRFFQACIPLLLAPLVYRLLDQSGSDKAVGYIVPWLAFGAVYLLLFCLLARYVKNTIVLTIASVVLSIPGAIGVTYLAIDYLRAHAGSA